MAQLGFTFYPKDWWTSDSFYALNPFERYIYLELLFMMYDNEGSIKNNKVMVERRLMTTIKDDVWLKISDLMVEDGDQLTHRSVNKRLSKAIASRENGKKGGAPSGNKNAKKHEEEQPKQPSETTQETTQNNPPYKREREIESKRENESEEENSLPPPAVSSENYLDGITHMELLDCAKAYFNSPRYQRAIDLLCMGQRVSVNGLKNLAMAFNEHCSLKGKVSRTLDDWASHFSNWVKDPKRNSNNQNSDEESATERRKRLLEEQRQRNAG